MTINKWLKMFENLHQKLSVNNINIPLRDREINALNKMMKQNDTKILFHIILAANESQPLIYYKPHTHSEFRIYKIENNEFEKFTPYIKTIGRYGNEKKKHIIYNPNKHIQILIEKTIKHLNKLSDLEHEFLKHMYLYSLRIYKTNKDQYYIPKVYNNEKVILKDSTMIKFIDNGMIKKEFDLTFSTTRYKLTYEAREKLREIVRSNLELKLNMSVQEWFEMPVLLREYVVRREIKNKSAKKKDPTIN